MSKRYIIYHLLNDLSGSPRMLSLVTEHLAASGEEVHLYTSHGQGFLTGIKDVRYHFNRYCISKFSLYTVILFTAAQFRFFLSSLRWGLSRNTVIYINTLLPVGAIIGSVITRARFVSHLHEKPLKRNFVQNISLYLIKRFASDIICVSEYHVKSLGFENEKVKLVRNFLPDYYFKTGANGKVTVGIPPSVLMASSLRKYKGVDTFVKVSVLLPSVRFCLLLSCDENEGKRYFRHTDIPENLEILFRQNDLRSFYQKSDIIVNLSDPKVCIETFGLSVLEGMACGLPAIVPRFGGLKELVADGYNGYTMSEVNENIVAGLIKKIFWDTEKYKEMSGNAVKVASSYSAESGLKKIMEILQ